MRQARRGVWLTLLWGSVAWGGGDVAHWEQVLDAPPVASGWRGGRTPHRPVAQRVSEQDGERVLALEGLGREGGAHHIDLLIHSLSERWPENAAAGHALGEMGRRGVQGAGAAIPKLGMALNRADPRTRRAAAYGIRRIGLSGASKPLVEELLRTWNVQGDSQTRAWLVEALGALSERDHKADLWLEAMGDTSRAVQVAGMRFASDGLAPEVLVPFLEDNDPWVRLETVRALGQYSGAMSGQAVHRYRQNGRDPWADVVGARARYSEGDLTSEDPMVRAAAAGHQEAEVLDGLVDADPESVVRVAAAASSLDRFPTRARARAYLVHADPAVQAVGAEMLAGTGTWADHTLLLETLEMTESEDTLHACLLAIHELSADTLSGETLARLQFLVQHLAPRIQTALQGPPVGAGKAKQGPALPGQTRPTWMAHVETTRGTFVIELHPDWAPVAVDNFVGLARDGFFDQQVFHRVVPGFVVQTGCPRGDGWGGPGHSIPDEVSRHPYVRGSVGMARSELDSGGSQWFVTTGEQPHLAGLYTQFGQVVLGGYVPERLTVGDRILSVRIEEVVQ